MDSNDSTAIAYDEDQFNERNVTLQRNISLSSSINNVCWVNIQEEKGLGEKEIDHNMNHDTLRSERSLKAEHQGSGCMDRVRNFASFILADFLNRSLAWIKLVFLCQSASMTVLYPYLNLHMKSLGISIQETAIINAVIPVLFIFTPPLVSFLASKMNNFRMLLSTLTGLGGLVSLLLLLIPKGRDISLYPEQLTWGLTCGPPGSRAQYQNLMIHGFEDDKCELKSSGWENASFTPGTCGYMCPTRSRIRESPRFFEYKVIWPNRGGGFGITEIVDVVSLDKIPNDREYHEPRIIDSSIFFPMNWTFQLNCDRIRTDDCIFNPVPGNIKKEEYLVGLSPMQLSIRKPLDHLHQEFVVTSIQHPKFRRTVSRTINCGSKSEIAQVVSTVETGGLGSGLKGNSDLNGEETEDRTQLVDTKLNDCSLTCMVNFDRKAMCNNTVKPVDYSPSTTFWSYLAVRTCLGVLTAASLMMFEGAVMATIQELGGDYGLQRFVGNFGAIVFAPLGGFFIDLASSETTDFSTIIYTYLALKIAAAVLILFVRLDFKPPGDKILANIQDIIKNAEVVMFLVMMMFSGIFWGYIEGFLFWFLDDIGATKLQMGWTITIGMVTSLPFLVFSGPITDKLGHVNVIILGMTAYAVRLIGYSFVEDPLLVYPYEALEGFTMALMMTSAVTYVARISTPKTIASVMGLMGSLFFGVGKGSGCLFGGLIMSWLGAKWTFRWLGINAILCSLTYLIFQICYVRPRRQNAKQADIRRDSSEEVDSPQQINHSDNYQLNDGSIYIVPVQGRPMPPPGSGSTFDLNNGPKSLNGGTRV